MLVECKIKAMLATTQPDAAMGWSVPDVRAAARALTARGVVFERFESMAQDDDGVWTPPGSSAGVCCSRTRTETCCRCRANCVLTFS